MKKLVLVLALLLATSTSVLAQTRVLRVAYTPTKRAQIAVWIEALDGTFLRTIMLTEAVGLRGIGNRPGALQMNSGFKWPFGRREGVLPIWAHRRAAAPSAMLFPRLVFQQRVEGFASGGNSSPDPYYCLSFNDMQNDNVDTVTCASVFSSDKGRLLTATDIANGYSEPYQFTAGTTAQRALSTTSLYPLRHDVTYAPPIDSAVVATFDDLVRNVMPDIDAVTRATAPADTAQLLSFTLPAEWPDGDYVVWVEANTERDLNATWSEAAHPTPQSDSVNWDSWSSYGYAYRGQPSIVYRIPVVLSAGGGVWSTGTAEGYGDLHGANGDVSPLDSTITNDAVGAPGSGVDRLRLTGASRITVAIPAIASCTTPAPVPAIESFVADRVDDENHSNEWARLAFTAVAVDGEDASAYQIKVSTTPITNETEFVQAEDAKAATSEIEGLNLCPVDMLTGSADCPTAGTTVAFDIGRLTYLTHYYVAVRAVGPCGIAGPIATADFETTAINFTTVAPCFVATAAHGSPMAPDVELLRAFRNDVLMASHVGRGLVHAYYAVGPRLAGVIAGNDSLRTFARAALRPFVQATDPGR